jgi:hypothetical protein
MVKLWRPDTWTLDVPQEIYLNKNANLGDFATALQKVYLDISQVTCTKINSPWNFHRVELPFVEWVDLQQNASNFLSSNPFYLSTDGILFIVRDGSTEIRDMSAAERDLYRCEEFESQMFSKSDVAPGTKRKGMGEQGVKITVMTK